nr:DNA methyltransferase [uncultured Nitrososphaera sp.]
MIKEYDDGNLEVENAREIVLGLTKKSMPSVLFVNYRSLYEDTYPAKFDAEVARLLIEHYSNAGDLVVDPFGGSGVIPLTAVELGRDAVYQDVYKQALDLANDKFKVLYEKYRSIGMFHSTTGDSTKEIKMPGKRKAKLVLTSPPFGLAISGAYNGKGKGPGGYGESDTDIGNSESYGLWREALKKVMKNCFDILQPNGMLIIEIRPRWDKGKYCALDKWIWQDCHEIGFEDFGEIIQVVPPWRMWTMRDKEIDCVKPFPYHANLLMFKKSAQEKLV